MRRERAAARKPPPVSARPVFSELQKVEVRSLSSCRPEMNKMTPQSPPGAGHNFDFTNAPAAITTSPGAHFGLRSPCWSLARPWARGPQQTRQVGDPTFLSGAKNFLVARVRSPAPRPQTPGRLPEPRAASRGRRARPRPRAPGRFGGAALLPPLSLSIRCTKVFVASRYLAIHSALAPAPERSARSSKVGRRGQARDPWGAAEPLLRVVELDAAFEY